MLTNELLPLADLPIKQVSRSRTAVYIGSYSQNYNSIFSRDPLNLPRYKESGSDSAMLSNRLS